MVMGTYYTVGPNHTLLENPDYNAACMELFVQHFLVCVVINILG